MEFYKTPGQQVTIRSAFEMTDDMKQSVLGALKELTGREVSAKFEVSPELIAGIDMKENNFRVSWNIDSYLDELRADLGSALLQKPLDETATKNDSR